MRHQCSRRLHTSTEACRKYGCPAWIGSNPGPVRDDQGNVWANVMAAARALGIHQSGICRSAKLGIPVKGRQFSYVDQS